MTRVPILLAAALACALLAQPAPAGGPGMLLAAHEPTLRSPDLVQAKAAATLARLTGLTALRVETRWQPGTLAPAPAEAAALRNAATAAALAGLRVLVAVVPDGPAATPATPELQAQLAAYAAAVAGLAPAFDDLLLAPEPNSASAWAPQLGPDGSYVAAAAYLGLLARAYDTVKPLDPALRLWAGPLAPRGLSPPGLEGSAPAAFVRDLVAAYRASGRQAPVLDGLALRPDAGGPQGPRVARPRSTTIGVADVDRLVAALRGFDGTAQPGSALPLLYDGFAVETTPPPGRRAAYTGKEASAGALGETRQAGDYAAALEVAFCQPAVAGLVLGRVVDDPQLEASQAGLFYADRTPKPSLYVVRDALRRVRGGSAARCDELALVVTPSRVVFPSATAWRRGVRDVRFTCDLDCAWEVRLLRGNGSVLARRRGFVRALEPAAASFRGARPAGPVRFALSIVHPVNPAVPTERESATRTLARGTVAP